MTISAPASHTKPRSMNHTKKEIENTVTEPGSKDVTRTGAKDVTRDRLILSLFPGIDLFSIPFEERGFSVVRGPDQILGQDIRSFHMPPGCVGGVIAGTPCQEFSSLNRSEPTGYGLAMLDEFKRLVLESDPNWWLLENVSRVPDMKIEGYSWQRFPLDLGWFTNCSRLRHFQFGSKSGQILNPPLSVARPCVDSAALACDKRPYSQVRSLQGLPNDFDLPLFTLEGKKRVVGNGVPLVLGRVISGMIDRDLYNVTGQAVTSVTLRSEEYVTCSCGCGCRIFGRAKYAGPACRKRASRRRMKG